MYEYQRNIRKGVCLYLGQYDRLRRQGAEEALDEPQAILKGIWMHQACKQAMKLLAERWFSCGSVLLYRFGGF